MTIEYPKIVDEHRVTFRGKLFTISEVKPLQSSATATPPKETADTSQGIGRHQSDNGQYLDLQSVMKIDI